MRLNMFPQALLIAAILTRTREVVNHDVHLVLLLLGQILHLAQDVNGQVGVEPVHEFHHCPVEPGHVHHGLLVGQLQVFLGDHQLDFIPFFRLIIGTQVKERRERKKCGHSLFLTMGRAYWC